MGGFGAVLGPPWHVMGAFGGLLGALWNDPHPTWHVMGHLGADLTRPGGVLDRPEPHLGGSWSLMVADLTRLGGVLDRPGPHLGASWSLMAAKTEKNTKKLAILIALGAVLALIHRSSDVFSIKFQSLSHLISKLCTCRTAKQILFFCNTKEPFEALHVECL